MTKVWKDFANIDGKRPDSITVNIYQQTFDVDGTATGEKMLYKTLTLTKDDLEKGSSTWRTVLADVPIAKYQGRCRRQYGVNCPIVCLCEDIALPYTEEMAQEIAAEQAPDSWLKRLPMQARHMVMGLVVILAVLIGRQLIG